MFGTSWNEMVDRWEEREPTAREQAERDYWEDVKADQALEKKEPA